MNRKEDIPRLTSEENIEIDIDFENINVKKKRRYPFFVLALLLLLILAAFIIFKISVDKSRAAEQVFLDSSESDEVWQGAFISREVFERCKAASVSVLADGKFCSGFVYSSDGWIATVEGIVNENVKGRIEVVLCDGRRFFVDSFRQNRESGLTLLKIDAYGLTSVNMSEEKSVFAGQELFTFCALSDEMGESSLFSGKVAHASRTVELQRADGRTSTLSLLQIGILLTEEGVGAPLFNESGELVGIGCASAGGDEGGRYMINYAFVARDVSELLSVMKEGKRAESDELFSFVVE